MVTEAAARRMLESMVASSDDPALTAQELTDLLDFAASIDALGIAPDQYHAWVANTAYAVGDYVTPRTRNGYYYRVSASDGAAGATEPTWPTAAGSVTQDGVTYDFIGTASWAGVWDLRRAAAEGWRWKAAKVASRYDFTAPEGASYSRDQLWKHCMAMAKQYDKGSAGSVVVTGAGSSYDPVIGNLNGGN